MKTIATLTMNPSLDVNTSIEHVLPEIKMRCAKASFEAAGGGINVCRAIRELGGDCVAIWIRGGRTGDAIAEYLEREKIPNVPIPVQDQTRQDFSVVETATNRQFRFNLPGPSLSKKEIREALRSICEIKPAPDFLVASGSLPGGVQDDFFAKLAGEISSNTKLIVDTSGKPMRMALDAGIYLIKPNLEELGSLAGDDITSDSRIESLSSKLIDTRKAEVVVVSLGAAGAVLVTREMHEHVKAPTVRVRSKIGAGDSMVAGMVYALAKGKGMSEVVKFGVACGAAAVMTPGTTLLKRNDAERLYNKMISGQYY